MANTTDGNRCPDIIYAGSALADSTQYFWRITFWDDDNTEGTVSATQNFTTGTLLTKTVYYSIGTGGDKKTGSPTITITSGTATLGAAQTGNVGVGDKITISGGTQSAVYISAVNSQTSFDVILVDGSTPVDDSGTVTTIARAYNTISTAVANAGTALGTFNLASAATKLYLVCYKDAAFSEAVQIDGYTTDADYFLTLTVAGASQVASGTSQRHNGTEGTGAVVQPPSGANYGISVEDPFTVVEWLEVDGTNVTVTSSDGVQVEVAGSANVIVQNLIIHDWTLANDGGIYADQDNLTVLNTIIYDTTCSMELTGNNGTIQNTTIYNGSNCGLLIYTGTGYTVENVVSMGNVGGNDFSCSGSVTTFNNNMSEDTSAGDYGGSGNLVSQTTADQFVSISGSIDLHLKTGADAIDAGKDLSGTFTDDIDGGTRAGSWDIGADEYGVGSATALYRSVGKTATELASGSGNALTISGSTATFGAGLANNIGVGDVIEYDSDGNSSIDALAFIHGRTDAKTYTVKDKDGGIPTAVTGDNDWKIYRAYTSLANWESQTENAD
jgi:hypothetical protein